MPKVKTRLGRAPTIEEVNRHHVGWFMLYEGSGTFVRTYTAEKARNLIKSGSPITDAIPLDEDGDPCPVGGWGEDGGR